MSIYQTVDTTTVTKQELFQYSIQISFTGLSDPSSQPWSLVDFIPSNMDYILPDVGGFLSSIQEDAVEGGTNLTFHFDTVSAGDTATLILGVKFGMDCQDGDSFYHQCSLYAGDERMAFSTATAVTLYYILGYSALKQVKGDLDEEFSKEATAKIGGTARYLLTVTNVNKQGITGVDLVDIFPYVGDTAVLDASEARGSQYSLFPSQNLADSISVTLYDASGLPREADLSLLYSSSQDPERFDAQGDTLGTGTWVSSLPEGEEVAALRVTLGADEILEGGEYIQVSVLVSLPLDAPEGAVAQNSFGVKGDSLRAIEPYAVSLSLVQESDPRQQAITDLIESVALEQSALSHILNAEGEKIQKAVALCLSPEDLILVNDSVSSLLRTVTQLEQILKEKLQLVST